MTQATGDRTFLGNEVMIQKISKKIDYLISKQHLLVFKTRPGSPIVFTVITNYLIVTIASGTL